jgi:mono/diheme cytochrome c family protein
MGRRAWMVLLWLAPVAAAAQPAGGGAGDQQKLGMRLFDQSCRVCHTKPQLISPQYAPVLSMNTLGGKEDVMSDVISNGTPRMPGFKYQFSPDQITAIVAYLRTVPPQQSASSQPAAPPASRGERERQQREAD